MSRLLDKTIVLLICLALLVRGPVDAALVSGLCVAVTLACLGEAAPERMRPFLALALLACGALAPDARAYLPLAAYDLARPRLPALHEHAGLARGPLGSLPLDVLTSLHFVYAVSFARASGGDLVGRPSCLRDGICFNIA